MGYCLNRIDEPVFMVVSKPLLPEFDIHHKVESCGIFAIHIQTLLGEMFTYLKPGCYIGVLSARLGL